jgi:ubiquitin carboxyl-terminal hydrolase 10
MQQYVPAPLPPQHQPVYHRPQHSPAIPPLYQAPPPQAPSSTRSTHTVPVPMTPPTPALAVSVPPASSPPEIPQIQEAASPIPDPEEPSAFIPFRAPVRHPHSDFHRYNAYLMQLPWLSRPDLSFPARRARRKRKPAQDLSAELVELPDISQAPNAEDQMDSEIVADAVEPEIQVGEASVVRPETPATSLPASEENNSTNPTTPSSSQQQYAPASGDTTPIAPKVAQRQAAPAVPVIPALPKTVSKDTTKSVPEKRVIAPPHEEQASTVSDQDDSQTTSASGEQTSIEEGKDASPAPKAWTTPKLWTGLFNPNTAPSTSALSESGQGALVPSGTKTPSESLAEALRTFNAVSTEAKVAFLEPRGLVNTGNMCYMNSVGC